MASGFHAVAAGGHRAPARGAGTWTHDRALVNRAGNPRAQLALFADYATYRALCPDVQRWLRTSGVPLLAIWGAGDQIFSPDGARAFTRDRPDTQIELLNTGHFAPETHLDQISERMLTFLGTAAGPPA